MMESANRSWMSELSQRQKQIVTYGVTSLAICAIALLATLTLILGSKVIRILSPAISPLVLGLLLSFVLRGFFEKVPDKIRGWVYWVFWALLALAMGVALWGWGAKLMTQVNALASTLSNTYNSVSETLPQFKNWISEVKVSEYLTRCVTFFVSGLKNVSTWLFAVFFGYCFLKRPVNVGRIVASVKGLPFLSFSDTAWKFIQDQLNDLVYMLTKYFPNQLLINIAEGLIGAIGMSVIGLPSGIVLGFLMGFMNIIPLVGTFIMLPVILMVAYFCEGGSFVLVLLALCVWAMVEAIDLVFPPFVHGREMNLPPGVTVFSFLFWGALIDPVWGMILAIPLTAFSLGFVRAAKRLMKREERQTVNQTIKGE